jgi:predicted transcriptional regulator of viral defense system
VPTEAVARPDWDRLYQVAAGQLGLFTTRQAGRAGYSPQLLNHHAKAGRIRRLSRGVFRLVHFPASNEEPLVQIWLWADRKAVFSHETALSLHDLSDVLPHRLHVTLPTSWVKRRLRIPAGVMLHCRPVRRSDLAWVGVLPVTTPERTILDCIKDHVSPEWVTQAITQARARGLVAPERLEKLRRAAEPRG